MFMVCRYVSSHTLKALNPAFCIHTVQSSGTRLSDCFQAYLIADASILLLFRFDDGGNIGGWLHVVARV